VAEEPAGAPVAETSFAGLAPDPAPEDEQPSSAGAPDPWEPEATSDRSWDAAADDDEVDNTDEDGCISIDEESTSSFASLMDDLAGLADEAAASLEQPAPPAPTEQEGPPFGLGAGTVNLLDEILAEEGQDILRSSDTEQLSTIASEIGRNVGEARNADPEAQYQQGLVYLELGLYDQAALALAAAAVDDRHAMQAREMWGIALQRSGQPDEALAVFVDGLADSRPDDRAALGLRYHAGCILQELGRGDEAQQYFREVHQVDAGFADVARRLRLQRT
jgi:tetratricopeptide (TPR) repeat protein